MTPAERMRAVSAKSKDTELDVWPQNMSTVHVYLRCQPSMLATFAGAALMGVSASEVLSAARMLRIPVIEWPIVIDGVQELAGMVAKIENDKAAARAKSKD